MAQLLYPRQSTGKCINIGGRHIRLCRRKGKEEFITPILPILNKLIEKNNETNEIKKKREAAYDDLVLDNHDLGDLVRTCYDLCKQLDREYTGRTILKLIFPDGKLSGIIYASLHSKPDIVELLVVRIESLGADHPLNEKVAGLKEGLNICRDSLKAYNNCITEQKMTKTLEDIAKTSLIQQYEYNYLDIARKYGKHYANKFFPIINSSTKDSKEVEDTNKEK